jgi:myosin heavy subunit
LWRHADLSLLLVAIASLSAQGFQNMTELAKLNEAELDRNLNVFYHKEHSTGTYCYCGNTLVAMNLFNPSLKREDQTKCGEMFSQAKMESVVDVPSDKVDAHIFALMEKMYGNVLGGDDSAESDHGSQVS